MREYLASVEHIVGQQAIVSSSKVADTANIPTSFLSEMDNLRHQIESLNDEKSRLRSELADRTAETNTLKALSSRTSLLDEVPVFAF